MTFGGLDMQFGGGQGCFPQWPDSAECVRRHDKCDVINVSKNENVWKKGRGREARNTLMAVCRHRQKAAEDRHSP